MPPADDPTLAPSGGLAGTRARLLLVVLCGAIFMEGLDVAMLGVALPAIRDDLGMSTGALQWVASAYVLGFGGFVLVGGRAADLLGRRRMFLLWLVVFIAFSGLGGLAGDGTLLIAARFVTGVAAGFLSPAGLSIITTTFRDRAIRDQAVFFYTGAGAAGFSLGLVVGGLLAAVHWRWVFFAPVIFAAVLLVVAVRIVPRDVPPGRGLGSGGFDLAGAATVTAGMLTVVLAVVRAPDVPAATTALSLAAAASMLAAFVAIERRATKPLVELGALRSWPLVRANLTSMLFLGAWIGFQFVVVLYLQEYRGWSALVTGAALVVVGSDAILSPTLTPRLTRRFGHARVLFAGLLLALLAYALFLPLGGDWSYLAMLPSFTLMGVAFALAFGPLTIAATENLPQEQQGMASGLLSMSTQFGAALGLAVVTAVVVGVTGPDPSRAEELGGLRAALVVPFAAMVLALGVSASGLRRPRPAG